MSNSAINLIGTNIPSGTLLMWPTNTAPAGWLLCYGATLGDASSGATFAGSEYENLYNVIQNQFGGTYNWANHNTVNLPDLRGRYALGKDNMGGVSADRCTDAAADTVGQGDGAEGNFAQHTHYNSYRSSTNANNVHVTSGTVHVHSASTTGDPEGTVNCDLSTSGTGSGNMPPYITLNYIIKI